jgi:hypothetical protein
MKKEQRKEGWDTNRVVDYLLSKCKTLNSNSPKKIKNKKGKKAPGPDSFMGKFNQTFNVVGRFCGSVV